MFALSQFSGLHYLGAWKWDLVTRLSEPDEFKVIVAQTPFPFLSNPCHVGLGHCEGRV